MKRTTEITVRRPDGKVETLIHPHLTIMDSKILADMQSATRKAGRGEVLGYRNLVDGRDEAEIIAEAGAEANKPVWVERQRATALFLRAEKLTDYPGEYFPALARAKQALDNWQAKYPSEASQERKDRLLAEAADLEGKALDALVYDADGWLDDKAKQARHDEYIAKAQAIRQEVAHA